MIELQEWQKSEAGIFWGEIAPTDHLVQIYDTDAVMLDSLEGFIINGINSGDSVLIIATNDHIHALNVRLKLHGHNPDKLIETHQYIPLNAHETLAKFMRIGWPNEELFMKTVKDIITLARGKEKRRVRAFGEMVAILWSQGYSGATVQLEHLWNKFCEKEEFCLFCAYPKSGFTQDPHTSIKHICSTHTKVISGLKRSTTEIFYKDSHNEK
jgi:hypothetical protein